MVLLWLMVAVWTVRVGWSGGLFEAPCLREMEKREMEKVNDGAIEE